MSPLSRTYFISSGVAILSSKQRSQHLMLHILLGTPFHVEEFASLSSTATLPMDLTLLHHCLCHYHLLSGNLVTGLKLDSKAEPDPVCEACKAGKMLQIHSHLRPQEPPGPSNSSTAMCMAIGYPQGYKGWKFYDPLTKQVLISECADFDEHFFMLQKHSASLLPPTHPQSLLESPPPPLQLPALLDSILDEDDDLIASHQPDHGGDVSTESSQSSVRFKTPPSTYMSLSEPSASPPALASPPSSPPSSPAPPPHPQSIRRPRSEWLPDQWAIP